jgi:ABC-type transport system involved in multi-copper enzyme maturation permease subunit
MRLVGAELIKLRKRWASYVVLAVLIALMAIVYLLIGVVGGQASGPTGLILRFPGAYGVINQFVFGLGSLLAVAYAAAIAGADWNWGVLRVIFARGESRWRYIGIKAVGIGIVLLIGAVVAYVAGVGLTYAAAGLAGVDAGNALAGDGGTDLARSLGLGSVVLLQRAAIGFAVAVLLRSQLAGVVIGIVLYIGEGILTSVMIALTFGGGVFAGTLQPQGTQWFQFLPFSIGDSVLAVAPTPTGDIGDLLLEPIPLALAAAVTVIYLVIAIGVSMLATERAEITV